MFCHLTFPTEFQNDRKVQAASFIQFCKTVSFFCIKLAIGQKEEVKSLYNPHALGEILWVLYVE
jgi:hypothetical protein